MALTYEQLADILLRSGKPFTIEQYDSRGNKHVYSGGDARAFQERRDGRRHEHKVFDPQGNLLYYRDVNGQLRVGHPNQWRAYTSRKAAGKTALSGMDVFLNGVEAVKRRWLG